MVDLVPKAKIQIREQDPLKQGLKRSGKGILINADVKFASKIH